MSAPFLENGGELLEFHKAEMRAGYSWERLLITQQSS